MNFLIQNGINSVEAVVNQAGLETQTDVRGRDRSYAPCAKVGQDIEWWYGISSFDKEELNQQMVYMCNSRLWQFISIFICEVFALMWLVNPSSEGKVFLSVSRWLAKGRTPHTWYNQSFFSIWALESCLVLKSLEWRAADTAQFGSRQYLNELCEEIVSKTIYVSSQN